MRKQLSQTCGWLVAAIAALALVFAAPQPAAAYPFWAQETAPETPREATGRIVCANCHLAKKPVEIELPLSVLPDSVFKAVVKIPYDLDVEQVLGDGDTGELNVGAVLMLPEGFEIAPEDRIPEDWLEETEDVIYDTYNEDSDNVIIVGPIPGEDYQEIVFPILSPDPRTDKNIHFGKYPIHLGGNRGRGQIYPTGEKTNNNAFTASAAGVITDIDIDEDGLFETEISIETEEGDEEVVEVPVGAEIIVEEGDEVLVGQALTTDPNVGGFGQEDAEIVLQSPARVLGLALFVGGIMLAQTMLVLKKKQIERVQAAEMDF